MKKTLFITLLLLLNFGCNSTKKIFNSGTVLTTNATEVIKLDIVNDLPFCFVTINGKDYKFLVDTGAPTVISEEIFKELNLKVSYTSNVTDSQKNKEKQLFTVLPNIKINALEFQNIGAVVINIDNDVFKCYNFDGIVGANLMAKLFWQFDYENNQITTSKKLSDFDIENCDFTLNFIAKEQKTPLIKGTIADKNLSFTFDTGFNGTIKVFNDYEFYKDIAPSNKFITKNGLSTIGIYGAAANAKTFEMQFDVLLDTQLFSKEVISSGASTLIGNEFLKDFVFVINWVDNKIYFKRNANTKPKQVDGFGFAYLFKEDKFKVIAVLEEADFPIQLDDEILSINSIDFTNTQQITICDYILHKKEDQFNEIDVKLKRNNDTLQYTMKRRVFIK